MAVNFPTFLFHKELAPDGKLFPNEASLPTGPGWVDTPAAFEPGYQAPVPPTAEELAALPEDARRAGFKPVQYPSTRYRINDPDHPKSVANVEDDEALERAEPGVWKDTPDPSAWAEKPAPSAVPVPPGPATRMVIGAAVDLAARIATGSAADLTDTQKADFYKATVPQIIEQLEDVGSVAMVDTLLAVEAANPKGEPRSTVVKALKTRRRALEAPTE